MNTQDNLYFPPEAQDEYTEYLQSTKRDGGVSDETNRDTLSRLFYGGIGEIVVPKGKIRKVSDALARLGV